MLRTRIAYGTVVSIEDAGALAAVSAEYVELLFDDGTLYERLSARDQELIEELRVATRLLRNFFHPARC